MQTDLNQRERQRFAATLRSMSKAAEECADALEAEDDSTAMVQWIILSLSGSGLTSDLQKVFMAAADAAKAASELANGEHIGEGA
jgi:hypothetical protein